MIDLKLPCRIYETSAPNWTPLNIFDNSQVARWDGEKTIQSTVCVKLRDRRLSWEWNFKSFINFGDRKSAVRNGGKANFIPEVVSLSMAWTSLSEKRYKHVESQ